jgi:hypothetical protein
MMKKLMVFLLLYSGFAHLANGQEAEETEEHEKEIRHRLMLVMGHAHISSGIDREGGKSYIVVPSWGLDYDYRFAPKWGVGIHTDFVVENFEVEEEGVVKKRSRPFTMALCFIRKFGPHFSVIGGTGFEFAKEDNLYLFRLGADYGWELPNEWEVGVSLMSDFKVDAYNSWVLGIGIAKLF